LLVFQSKQGEGMKMIRINFNAQHKAMLGQTKMPLEEGNSSYKSHV
jgi:hypothetical protein